VVTFKNGGLDKFLPEIPIEKIVLETDSPYLAPVPHRGKRNEVAFLDLVVNKLAEIYSLSPDEVKIKTSQNAKKLIAL
jgi:TatD DNase family protein